MTNRVQGSRFNDNFHIKLTTAGYHRIHRNNMNVHKATSVRWKVNGVVAYSILHRHKLLKKSTLPLTN